MTSLPITNKESNLFRRLAWMTVIVVFLLIMVGSIVRATGSGMGCPDWPKCFGSWIPPTDVSQLPPNYAQIYGAKLKGEVIFNPTKTWIEYLNRLLGVFTGFLIFGTLIASIRYLRKDSIVFYISLAAFILVGFEGWLGSKVVATELEPLMITLHMLVAIIIAFLLLYVLARSYNGDIEIELVSKKRFLNNWLVGITILSLIQVLIGTQVREAVDAVGASLGAENRHEWIENLGLVFYIHRSYSILIIGLQLGWIYWLKKYSNTKGILNRLAIILGFLVLIEIVTGIIMAYGAIPPMFQPIHLTLATIVVGIQFVSWLLLNDERVFKNKYQIKPV